jgi:hypothetical protein
VNTETLSERKMNLIVRISKLDKEESVRQVENVVDIVEQHPTEKQLEMLEKLAKPMRKKLNLEELKREQNWKPINRAEFDRLVKELDIQEPLEQLLADI